jgi:hypothetical protein
LGPLGFLALVLQATLCCNAPLADVAVARKWNTSESCPALAGHVIQTVCVSIRAPAIDCKDWSKLQLLVLNRITLAVHMDEPQQRVMERQHVNVPAFVLHTLPDSVHPMIRLTH